MSPARSTVSAVLWLLFLIATVSSEPGPQYSVPSLVWYPVPTVPLVHLVEEAQAAEAVAVAVPATPRKVVPPSASTPGVGNALGVTVAKQRQPGCPYCDSSVFPYCSDKLLHDACCCLDPYEQGLPPQCQLADCSFLHANSCKEHRLITRCCCDRLLYIKR